MPQNTYYPDLKNQNTNLHQKQDSKSSPQTSLPQLNNVAAQDTLDVLLQAKDIPHNLNMQEAINFLITGGFNILKSTGTLLDNCFRESKKIIFNNPIKTILYVLYYQKEITDAMSQQQWKQLFKKTMVDKISDQTLETWSEAFSKNITNKEQQAFAQWISPAKGFNAKARGVPFAIAVNPFDIEYYLGNAKSAGLQDHNFPRHEFLHITQGAEPKYLSQYSQIADVFSKTTMEDISEIVTQIPENILKKIHQKLPSGLKINNNMQFDVMGALWFQFVERLKDYIQQDKGRELKDKNAIREIAANFVGVFGLKSELLKYLPQKYSTIVNIIKADIEQYNQYVANSKSKSKIEL
jgi:hypothetical protein